MAVGDSNVSTGLIYKITHHIDYDNFDDNHNINDSVFIEIEIMKFVWERMKRRIQ